MQIYPILGCNVLQYQTQKSMSFGGLIPQKEIKNIGTDYIKRSENAHDREEIYDVASKYFHEGILPLIEKKQLCKINASYDLFRQEIINAAASKIELEFNPEFISFKKKLRQVFIKKRKEYF